MFVADLLSQRSTLESYQLSTLKDLRRTVWVLSLLNLYEPALDKAVHGPTQDNVLPTPTAAREHSEQIQQDLLSGVI